MDQAVFQHRADLLVPIADVELGMAGTIDPALFELGHELGVLHAFCQFEPYEGHRALERRVAPIVEHAEQTHHRGLIAQMAQLPQRRERGRSDHEQGGSRDKRVPERIVERHVRRVREEARPAFARIQAEMAHDGPLTTDLGDGIVQIRLPMSGNPMRYINAYLLADQDGWTLVDCGWKADDVFEALNAGLAEHGRSLADIRRLLITHVHFDHYGLAGTLMRAGVPVLAMHPRDWQTAQRHLTDPAAFDRAADAWIARNGFQIDDAEGFVDELQHHRTELTAPTELLEDGAEVGRLRAMWTPGHTPGHLCFFDRVTGKLLTGDHVLDPVTPHVGIWVETRGDALGEYEDSLQRVVDCGAAGALPAHGEPFADAAGRAVELLAHHRHREQQILAALERGALSGTDVARALPWRRRGDPFDELHEMHRQFAVAETLAHLEHLRAQGIVARDLDATPIRYALVEAAQRV